MPLEALGRPRIDVTVRISGFFRDAFPHLIKLLDDAVQAVSLLEEPPERNFVRKHYLTDLAANVAAGLPEPERQARYRIFGSRPGCYGAGLLPLIDERNWRDDADFAETYVNWGGYAYTADAPSPPPLSPEGRGEGVRGVDARDAFRRRLGEVQVALHNQDNREHDIFDSDDYFQFHGGMIATIRVLTGRQPRHYFGDTHDPARPAVRDLKQEALRVFRTRVINPKWLESITRHGYKGGLELAATVDYLFGYDATAGVAEAWMYEQVARAYALDPAMQEFFAQSNPWALHAVAERLLEAAQRGMWDEPDPETLDALRNVVEQRRNVGGARRRRRRRTCRGQVNLGISLQRTGRPGAIADGTAAECRLSGNRRCAGPRREGHGQEHRCPRPARTAATVARGRWLPVPLRRRNPGRNVRTAARPASVGPWKRRSRASTCRSERRRTGYSGRSISSVPCARGGAFQPGLLAAAHRGILYIDEVNLLPDHLVDVLLDAAALGVNTVEREGVSAAHPARFLLIGTMNREEGDLRPQLLDRFGLMVEVFGPRDPMLRAEVVRRRLAFESGPTAFAACWEGEQESLRRRIVAARERLPQVLLDDALLAVISRLCCEFEVDGLRADIVMHKTARALAALDGRAAAAIEDVRAAAELVLPHRRRRRPFEQPRLDRERLDESLARMQAGEPGLPAGFADSPRSVGSDLPAGFEDSPCGVGSDPGLPAGFEDSPRGVAETGERVFEPAAPQPVRRIEVAPPAGIACTTPRGRRNPTPTRERGHYVRAVADERPSDLAVDATIRAAVLRGGQVDGRPVIERADLHRKERAGRTGTLILFAVDVSGSMAARRRMELVKGAVLGLLQSAYEQRDEVGVIAFRGALAELALAPTGSVELADRALRACPREAARHWRMPWSRPATSCGGGGRRGRSCRRCWCCSATARPTWPCPTRPATRGSRRCWQRGSSRRQSCRR